MGKLKFIIYSFWQAIDSNNRVEGILKPLGQRIILSESLSVAMLSAFSECCLPTIKTKRCIFV